MQAIIGFLKKFPIITAIIGIALGFGATQVPAPSDGSTVKTLFVRILLVYVRCFSVSDFAGKDLQLLYRDDEVCVQIRMVPFDRVGIFEETTLRTIINDALLLTQQLSPIRAKNSPPDCFLNALSNPF